MNTARRHAQLLSVLLVVTPGCFLLERAESLEPGSVRGTAVDDGAGVPHPGLRLDASGRRLRGDADGRFLVRDLAEGPWLLHASVDEDGNGWPELAAFRSFGLRRVPHGAAGPRLTAIDLGDVALLSTIEVAGVVVRRGRDPDPRRPRAGPAQR